MPAKPKAIAIDINLLPKDPFSESSVGKFLEWALSTGRYIVIFTEMVVILTFLQRFTLDRQLSELNERVFEKKAVLDSFSDFEAHIKEIQERAEFIDDIEKKADVLEIMEFLSSNVPSDVIFDRVNSSNQVFVIDGIAYSQESLSRFVDSIRQRPDVVDVSLDKIATEERSSGINFKLRIDFNQPEVE